MSQSNTIFEELKEAYNLMCSSVKPSTVFDTFQHDEDALNPEELYYDGDYYHCPDDRCNMRTQQSSKVEEHVQITHDTELKKHFIRHSNILKEWVNNRIKHIERLKKYQEETEQEVMELQDYKENFENGLAVCVICSTSFKKVNDANKHKREEGHNVWIRRLETSFNDPAIQQ